ncbi:MAG TPA: hypothetical protein VMC83_18115 [Streptosporangiaceae bacterium]|nr:hypothetical protein [Streptosporangiaceae bacterium]
MTRGTIEYRLRPDGPWRQILPAVYLTVTGTASADQRETAALLYAGPQSVITGPVAVRRHNLRCAGLNLLDVLVPADSRRKSTGYVQIQRTIRMPGDLYATGPVRFTAPARAVADAARGMTRFSDVQALVCEAIQRSRCTLEELITELNAGPSAGRRWYRMALVEVSEGIRSAAEAGLKHLVDRSDLEKPLYNADLYTLDGVFLGRPDAWFGRAGVAGEVDSRQYHLGAKDYEQTTMRHNRMEAAGIHVLHWLPSTIKAEPHRVIADLRNAIAAGHKRPQLPITAIPPRV